MSADRLRCAGSADRDFLGESIAREQFEKPMERELLRMARRGDSTDDHLSLYFRDRQIANPAMSRLANLRLDPLSQAWQYLGRIKHHDVSLPPIKL
jgi:hypothetical protein